MGSDLPGEGDTQQGAEVRAGGTEDAVQEGSGEDGMVMEATVALNMDSLDNGQVDDDVLGDVLGDPVKGDLETVPPFELKGVADMGGDSQETAVVGGDGGSPCAVMSLVGQEPSNAPEAEKMECEGENNRGIEEATPPSFTGADSCSREERMEVDPLAGMEQPAQVRSHVQSEPCSVSVICFSWNCVNMN